MVAERVRQRYKLAQISPVRAEEAARAWGSDRCKVEAKVEECAGR